MKALAFVALLFFGVRAHAQSMPDYDVERWCKQVAGTSGGSQVIYGGCIDMEQGAYDDLKPRWAGLLPRVQKWCDQVARAGGSGSYSLLQGCVQMEENAAAENSKKQFRR